tara:strand:- start:3022 stop:4959 length:1938 start_codon:yes stop_codon:yes gene_type:complete
MAQQNLQVTELDFDDIKANLKTYLKGQSEFSDYNFEGSGLSVLIDLLAYNTHYLGMNANMLANEMFLDSATLRSSVVSHAKKLNYTPRSARAPIAYLSVQVNNNNLASVTIDKGTKFTTTVDNKTYGFVVNESLTTQPVNGVLKFTNLPIYEGTLTTAKYTVNSNNPEKRYILTSDRADTDTLKVTVQTSTADTTTEVYTLARDISVVSDTDKVYFLQEIDDGRFEVYFGDDVIGKKPANGNIVILEYIVTNKTEANGATSFTGTAVGGETNITVETLLSATGGSEPETIESIKYYAPLSYSSQRRAVTTYDYKSIVPEIYPNIKSIQVWGGEDNDPPIYGQVYVAISPLSGNKLTEAQKEFIVSGLKPYNIASVRPVIVDPETIFILIDTNFRYNAAVTTKTASDLQTLVTSTISNYSTGNLEKFDNMFRYSELTRLIDETDLAILSNITRVRMYKKITPQLNTETQYVIKFFNKLHNPHSGHGSILSSTGFKISGSTAEQFLDDDGIGNVRRFSVEANQKVYANASVGTIDYTAGSVTLNNLSITSATNTDGTIDLKAIPDSNDILPVRNQLLQIDIGGSSVLSTSDNSGQGASTTSYSSVGNTASTMTSTTTTGTTTGTTSSGTTSSGTGSTGSGTSGSGSY